MLPTAFAAAVGLYVIFFAFNLIRSKYKHHQQSRALKCQEPSHMPGPFFGLINLAKAIQAHRERRISEYIDSMFQDFGNTFKYSTLMQASITTIEPENIKAILATQFNDFGLGSRHEQFYPFLGDGIFTLDGAGWSHSRALLRPQFAREQVS